MDNLRLFLWVGLGMLLWLTFQAWQADYPPVRAPASVSPADPAAGPMASESDIRGTGTGELPALPDAVPSESSPALAPPQRPADRAQRIRVQTDVLDLEIGLTGGDIREASLPAYPVAKDQPDVPVTLLNTDPATVYAFRTGLRAADGAAEPTHRAEFTAAQKEFRLADGQDELIVPLTWQDASGLRLEKIYRFRRGRYDIELDQRLINGSSADYRAVAYQQIYRRHNPPDRSMFDVDSYSYVGPVAYDGERYEKLDPEDLADEPLEQTVANGWIASIQHHFLAAIVPPPAKPVSYRATFDGAAYTISAIDNELVTIPPGASADFQATLFVGPKLQSQLEDVSSSLPLTVDYGLLTLLAQPLFWILENVHDFIGNWGWTIILVTLLIKLVFYKLTETSGRSMAKMRKMQPRMKALQERYKDDREAMSKALMELYKREKVNPAAGCLPMLVQIPFFIAFYWVLLESVEMRQAPFMLWITDLSSRDPYFILPLLMGAAMWFQQKLNPAPPDPMQAKVMQFLPIIFTGMFAFFPAGLVLYWFTNSVLSMLQQWRINKVLGAD